MLSQVYAINYTNELCGALLFPWMLENAKRGAIICLSNGKGLLILSLPLSLLFSLLIWGNIQNMGLFKRKFQCVEVIVLIHDVFLYTFKWILQKKLARDTMGVSILMGYSLIELFNLWVRLYLDQMQVGLIHSFIQLRKWMNHLIKDR